MELEPTSEGQYAREVALDQAIKTVLISGQFDIPDSEVAVATILKVATKYHSFIIGASTNV